MKAVVIQEAGKATVAEKPVPSMRPDYIRVKTVAVALNPTDATHRNGMGPPGSILGMRATTRQVSDCLIRAQVVTSPESSKRLALHAPTLSSRAIAFMAWFMEVTL
jgi:hypothetical protein